MSGNTRSEHELPRNTCICLRPRQFRLTSLSNAWDETMTCNKLQLSVHSHPTVHLMQLLKEISGLVLHWTELHTWQSAYTDPGICIWSLTTIPILKNEFFCHEIKSRKHQQNTHSHQPTNTSLVVHDVVLNPDSLDYVSSADLSHLQNQITISDRSNDHCQKYLLPFGSSCSWGLDADSSEASSGSQQTKRRAYHCKSSNVGEGRLTIAQDAVVFLYAVDPVKHNSLASQHCSDYICPSPSQCLGWFLLTRHPEISRAGLV